MMTDKNVAIFGPYFGSFEQEIINFRPYITWMNDLLKPEKSYLSTHFNRKFLYDDIFQENRFIPIYKQFTRDEINQIDLIHKSVDLKDFNFFLKKLKEEVCNLEECSKKEVDVHNIKYIKASVVYPIHNKKFKSINVPEDSVPDELKDVVLFIPFGSEKKMSKIYKYVTNIHNVTVIGDMKSPLPNENVILKYTDYLENGLKYIIGAITYAKAVICPLSFWTVICNLQNVPVFSWGENPGQYREGGIYHFGNNRSKILPEVNDIEKSFSDFLEKRV